MEGSREQLLTAGGLWEGAMPAEEHQEQPPRKEIQKSS